MKKFYRNPFDGQWMKCQICGRVEKSHPNVESQWNHVLVDGVGLYICPECWHKGSAPASFVDWLAGKLKEANADDEAKGSDMSAGWEP